jgi:sn-glycerol 3-phosphate transport system substrate-binding protein
MARWFLTLVMLFPLLAQSTPLTLQFWHSMTGPKGELLQQIVREFNAAPENQGKLVVDFQFVGSYEEGLNKLRTALLAHRGPHIAQITDIGTQLMVDSKSITPLYHFTDSDADFPMAQLLLPIRRYYEVGGHMYSLPFATSNPIIYYNAAAFKKAGLTHPPKTYAELEEFSRKLTDKATKTTGITWPLHSWFFEQFMARQGKELTNHENGRSGRATEVNLTTPEAAEFVNLWARMVKEGTFSNVGRGWDPAEQNFLAGRSAMLITSTSDVFEVLKHASFPVATAPIPSKDATVKGGTIVGGNSLWILAGKPEAEQKAAYQFIKFMASKPIQRKWHSGTGYFPIRADLIADLEKEGFYKKYPAAKTAIDQLRGSADMPATWGALIGNFPEVRESIESAIEKVLAGRLETAAALKSAKEESDKNLQRYNRGHGGS